VAGHLQRLVSGGRIPVQQMDDIDAVEELHNVSLSIC